MCFRHHSARFLVKPNVQEFFSVSLELEGEVKDLERSSI